MGNSGPCDTVDTAAMCIADYCDRRVRRAARHRNYCSAIASNAKDDDADCDDGNDRGDSDYDDDCGDGNDRGNCNCSGGVSSVRGGGGDVSDGDSCNYDDDNRAGRGNFDVASGVATTTTIARTSLLLTTTTPTTRTTRTTPIN